MNAVDLHLRALFIFLAIFYLAFTALVLFGQDFRFEGNGEGGGYQLIEPKKPEIVFVPPLDRRPVWLRALRSLRPWVAAAPHSRLSYNETLDLYELDGSIGVGLRGKVEF